MNERLLRRRAEAAIRSPSSKQASIVFSLPAYVKRTSLMSIETMSMSTIGRLRVSAVTVTFDRVGEQSRYSFLTLCFNVARDEDANWLHSCVRAEIRQSTTKRCNTATPRQRYRRIRSDPNGPDRLLHTDLTGFRVIDIEGVQIIPAAAPSHPMAQANEAGPPQSSDFSPTCSFGTTCGGQPGH